MIFYKMKIQLNLSLRKLVDFNACPVLRLNINEYDILQNENSIEPIIKKIGHFLQQTRKLVK
jgi:deoxyadenosine/deoxycytidine kinase